MTKVIFTISLIFLIYTPLFAQNFWQRSLPNNTRPLSICPTYDSGWVLSQVNDVTALGTIDLFDKKGNIINSHSLAGDSSHISFISRILTDSVNNIYALGNYENDCDVFKDHINVVFKFDKDLNLVWRWDVNLSDPVTLPEHGGMAFGPDGYLYVVCASRINTFDPSDGTVIKSINFRRRDQSDPFTDIAVASAQRQILMSPSTFMDYKKRDTTLVQKTFKFRQMKQINSNSFLAFGEDIALVVDSFLNTKHFFLSPYVKIYDVTYSNSCFYMTASKYTNDSGLVLVKLDSSMNKIWEKKLPNSFKTNYVSVNNGLLALTGIDQTDNKSGRTLIQTGDTSGTFGIPKNDVGVIRIIPGKVTLNIYNAPYGSATLNLNTVIKNFGSTRVDSVTIYSTGGLSHNCVPGNTSTTFHNLALAPGDTLVLKNSTSAYAEYFTTVTKTPFYYTAYTCSPNGQPDGNTLNDFKTDSFTYTGIVENNENIAAFQLFPNPVQSIFNIESTQDFRGKFNIMNTLGQVFQTGTITQSKSSMSVEKLPSGMYFLQLRNEHQSEVLKFVKE